MQARGTPCGSQARRWSHIDRDLVDAVLQLSFLSEARNVVLVAPQGLGKTMIAQNIASRALLCIDEIGYLSYDTRNADLLFQVVSRRYERRSLVMTTNLAFAEWATVFPNTACTTALIDRVVHRADIIAIEGESYRKREAQAAITKAKSARKTKG